MCLPIFSAFEPGTEGSGLNTLCFLPFSIFGGSRIYRSASGLVSGAAGLSVSVPLRVLLRVPLRIPGSGLNSYRMPWVGKEGVVAEVRRGCADKVTRTVRVVN